MKPETIALSTLFAVLAGCHAVDVSQPDPMAHAATRAPRTVDEPARSPRPQQDPTARAAMSSSSAARRPARRSPSTTWPS
jgi:hypothetical protein